MNNLDSMEKDNVRGILKLQFPCELRRLPSSVSSIGALLFFLFLPK